MLYEVITRDDHRLRGQLDVDLDRAGPRAAVGVLDRLHEMAFSIRPRLLDELGLREAARSFLTEFEERTGVEVIDRITSNQNRDDNLILLNDLCDTMIHGSLCAMGGLTPFPVRSAVDYFPEDFDK